MTVSIIIPAHDAEATLRECLDACRSQTYDGVEVVVVDDGSTDGTARIAEDVGVHCVRQMQRGPAAARNRGASETKGEFVAFTDADCVPACDWIERLLARFDEDTVAVGGAYGIANNGAWLARLVHAEIVARHARFGDEVDFIGSFNMACLRDAFEQAGGFDEDFRAASGEDNDLSYRLGEAGAIRYAPDAVVDHYHPERLGTYLRTQARHGFWRMKLYAKHPGRASGDQYAAWFELMSPAMPVAVTAALLSVRPVPGAGLAAIVSLALWVAIHAPLAVRMVRASGAGQLVFVPVAMLRDVARAAGMLRGAWHFLVRGKASI